MRIPQSALHRATLPSLLSATLEGEQSQNTYGGHTHFWDRALSRRQVIVSAAAGAAAVVGAELLTPGMVEAEASLIAPKPIPETLMPGLPFHVLSPGSEEPSTITDFKGVVGATEIQGTGTDGLLFDVDMRFIQGTYIGVNGKIQSGTFGFV
jgi:hypothetical protein